MYEKMIQQEFARARKLPLTVVKYKGSEIFLFRADQLAAGVKTAIGRCLVASALDAGKISSTTKALVIQGAGNTVTAVKHAAHEFQLAVRVVAVVYAETSAATVERLKRADIEVVAMSPRSEGRTGRQNTAALLCEQDGYVFLEQHEEPLIIDIQERTFGRAIAEQLTAPTTHFIAGVGTGGTLFGIGAALKATNPTTQLIGVEGVGSTLSLWHSYLGVRGQEFEVEKRAIEKTLTAYQAAGMLASLAYHPERSPDEWFEISVDFPAGTSGVLGIEGFGVGDPSELILTNLPLVSRCKIVTDEQSAEGIRLLAEHGIPAVASAGANFFTARQLAEELTRKGAPGHIVTVVTGRG